MNAIVLNRTMKDGKPFLIRECMSEDALCRPDVLRRAISDGLLRMSAQSRWQRFAGPVSELSESELDYLTDLDGTDRVAVGAAVMEGEHASGVGLARYFRLADEPDVAEFAVTVIDEFQGQGIGTALLADLIEVARGKQLHRLRGYLLPGNRPMLRMCKRFDADIQRDGAFFRAEIVLQ